MKVYIGPYKNWFGPYQLAEKLTFFAPKKKDEYGVSIRPDWVYNFGDFLAHGKVDKKEIAVGEIYDPFNEDKPKTWLYKFLLWVDKLKERKIKVRIDKYDTWSMDQTLAYIILPMLKQLKENKHGSPYVDDDDVPENLRSTAAPPKKNDYDVDDNHFLRWDWVLDEIIFAFECKVNDDWEEEFFPAPPRTFFKKLENGSSVLVSKEENDYDSEGYKKVQERISNGFRLFGKYYEGLWD